MIAGLASMICWMMMRRRMFLILHKLANWIIRYDTPARVATISNLFINIAFFNGLITIMLTNARFGFLDSSPAEGQSWWGHHLGPSKKLNLQGPPNFTKKNMSKDIASLVGSKLVNRGPYPLVQIPFAANFLSMSFNFSFGFFWPNNQGPIGPKVFFFFIFSNCVFLFLFPNYSVFIS